MFLGGSLVNGGASLDSSVASNVVSDDALLISTFGIERLFPLGGGKSDVDFFGNGFGDVKDVTTLMNTNAKEEIMIFMVITVIGCTMNRRSSTIVQASTSRVWIDSQIFWLNLLCSWCLLYYLLHFIPCTCTFLVISSSNNTSTYRDKLFQCIAIDNITMIRAMINAMIRTQDGFGQEQKLLHGDGYVVYSCVQILS